MGSDFKELNVIPAVNRLSASRSSKFSVSSSLASDNYASGRLCVEPLNHEVYTSTSDAKIKMTEMPSLYWLMFQFYETHGLIKYGPTDFIPVD